MTRRTFANELEQAADQIADVSKPDLQILLRRAAMRFRSIDGLSFDPMSTRPSIYWQPA